MGSLSDREIVAAFVDYLKVKGHPDLKIDRYPEDEDRNSKEIDAIAGPFAIEHTSIETLPNQRRDSSWFDRVVGDLEPEFKDELDYRIKISIPYEGIKTGQNWKDIERSLREWIRSRSPELPDGLSLIERIDGIPFTLWVFKSSTGRPGLIFSRTAPHDNTLPYRLRNQLNRKAEKLAPYKEKGYTTILLFESNDIALMDEILMLEL